MESLLIFAVFIVFMFILSRWSRAKINKAKGRIDALISEARTLGSSGKNADGLLRLYQALGYVVGIGSGTTEWTSKGLVKRMQEQGWSLITEIEKFQKQCGLTYAWSEFKQIIDDFQQFSQDKKLVDKYGMPKKAGKDIYAAMRAKLATCLESMPKI